MKIVLINKIMIIKNNQITKLKFKAQKELYYLVIFHLILF